MKPVYRVWLLAVIMLVGLVGLSLTLQDTGAPVAEAQTIPGGIVGGGQPATLLNGTQGYTTAVNYSAALDTKFYGSVQVAVGIVGTDTITVTPQFALQDINCANATQWFTSSQYMPYQPYSIVSSATTVTESVGAWTTTSVTDQFSVVGGNVGSREMAGNGICFRVMLSKVAAGSRYTPTVIARPLNRN